MPSRQKLSSPSSWNPELLVLGHVTRDEHADGVKRLGGAAAFAARAAACLGVPTGIVTVAPRLPRLLAPLYDDVGITFVRRSSREITAFDLDYSTPQRRIYLRHRARSLAPADIPSGWLASPVCYVAPVIGECPRPLVDALEGYLVLGAQGWLRAVDASGLVVPAIAPEFLDLPRGVRAVVFSEQDHPEAEELALHLAKRVGVVALTRGAAGVSLFEAGRRHDLPAVPAVEIDPTGAGDVFGVVLALLLYRGAGPRAAALAACEAAARVVEGPGLGALPTLCGQLSVSSTSLRTSAASTLPL